MRDTVAERSDPTARFPVIVGLGPALKEATRVAHERLESRLGLPWSVTDLNRYRAVLHAMRGFYAPLEERLHAHAGLADLVPDLPERRKLPGLDADLTVLGASPARRRRAPLPEIHSTGQALGAAYVVEGATLGGASISRHLRRTLPAPGPQACRFFAPYGSATGARWRTFQTALATHDAGGADRAPVLAAAGDTFVALERWLQREGLLR